MLKFFLGLLILGIGVIIVIKTETILNTFGRLPFFEKHFGSDGGSRLGYKMIGLFCIFIGALVMTGMINGFVEWFLSPLLKFNR